MAIRLYRSAKYNHSNYELIEYSNVVNTYLLLMKRFTFLLLRKLFSLVIHPDILCIVYVVAQLCACLIVHLDLESKSLLSSVPLNNCYYELLFIHSPPLPFFFYHQFFFWGFFIRITRWTKIRLSEDLSLKQAYHNAVNYDSIVQF